MNIKHKLGILIILLFFGSVSLFSQNLPYMHFKMLKNDTLSFVLYSNSGGPIELIAPEYGDIDNTDPGNGTTFSPHDIFYYPDLDFVGRDKVVFKYHGNPGTNWLDWSMKKIEIDIDVLNSILETKNDYLFLNPNSAGEFIDVLANDSTTGDTLILDRIFNETNCEATITGGQIFVHPDDGFAGVAFFNYIVKDNFGSSTTGNVIINVQSEFLVPGALKKYVTVTNRIPIILSSTGFSTINGGPSLGVLDFSNDPELIYTPYVDSIGIDIFELSNGTDTIEVEIDVLESNVSSNVIVDDTIFTVPNTSAYFNVADNDFDQTSFIISNYSSPSHGTLTHVSNGACVYTPDVDFVGFDKFTYTRQLNFNYYQTATVHIMVSDFKPDNNLDYLINVGSDKSFVLHYNPPVDSFSFVVEKQPDNGNVEIFNGMDTIEVNCQEVTGRNLIVYTPNPGFTGQERFEIKYYSASGAERLIKIDLNVMESESDSSCFCTDYTCVWEGDTDGDGIVCVKDLLPIAINAGIEGNERSENTGYWFGLNSTDWIIDSTFTANRLKYTDCDGDGFISDIDKNSIDSNYNKIHNLYFSGKLVPTQFPVYLTTDQDTVLAGEVLYLNIIVGDEDYPAKDISGLSYILQLGPQGFADSASVNHNFLSDSWLSYASTTMDIWKQPFAGQVEAAIGRVGGNGITGIGLVSTCDFIIEDDLLGLKKDFNGTSVIPITLKLSNISMLNSQGNYTEAPESEVTVYLKRDNKNKNKDTQINIFPIPSSDEIHLNMISDEHISGYRIYNTLGQVIDNKNVDNQKEISVSTGAIRNGIYFIEVKTDADSRIVRKIEVMK